MWRTLAAGLAAGVLILAAVFVLVDRMAADQHSADRRALIARNAALSVQALAQGSPLACIETGAGSDTACELAIFGTAQSAAAATLFVAERLNVLAAADALAKDGDRTVLPVFRGERAVLAKDRFGLVSHVLARRYGCRADHCAELAWLGDAAAVKVHLDERPFERLIAGYQRLWHKPSEAAPVASAPPVPPEPVAPVASATPAQSAPVASAAMRAAPAPMPLPRPLPFSQPAAARAPVSSAFAKADPSAPRPLDPKWKLPSASSIPAISIIAPEPKLPRLETSERKEAEQKTGAAIPIPLKRPQAEATPAPEAR